MEPVLASLAAAVLLVALWASANRRHRARRAPQQGEWGEAGRPDLWTSAARCPSCGQPGGLLSTADDAEVWFTCLTCGQRHRRQHRA